MESKLCDSCKSATATLYCKADTAFLCTNCDSKVHAANKLASRHARVWLCQVHATGTEWSWLLLKDVESGGGDDTWGGGGGEVYKNNNYSSLFGDLMDPYSDLDDHSTPVDLKQDKNYESVTDCVVPVGSGSVMEIVDFADESKDLVAYGHNNHTLSSKLLSSSMEVAVVPDGRAMMRSSLSVSLSTASTGVDETVVVQLSGVEREARVLRYREKRKNRKFEKTIRYASRKAYAETRPRIKGRFAKRSDSEVDDVVNPNAAVYGFDIVSSF